MMEAIYQKYTDDRLDLTELVEHLPDLILKTDPQGFPLYANRALRTLYGRDLDPKAPLPFQGSCFEELVSIPPLDILRGQSVYVESYFFKEGAQIWVGWNVKGIFSSIGSLRFLLWSGWDITRQKSSKDAIDSERERMILAFEGANDALYDWDFYSHQILHSPRWNELFGFPGNQTVHHIEDWHRMVHPEDLPKILQKQRDHFEGKTSHYLAEYRVKTYTGEWKWILSRGRAICDTSGKPLRMAGSNTDITELRQSQEKLKEISNLLKATLDTIPDIIGIQDSNHTILQYNEAGYRFFQYQGKDIAGEVCYQLLGRTTPCPDCAVDQTIETGRPVRKEQYDPHTGRWLDVRTYPVLDENGKVLKVVEHLRDITSSKKVAEALIRTNSILKAQQEAALDGILIVNENNLVVDFNTRFLEIWGIPYEAARFGKDSELLRIAAKKVKNPEAYIRKVEYLYAHPWQISRDEAELVDGTVLDRYSAPVASPNGTYYGRIWFFTDITEIKNNERALKESIDKNEALLQEIVALDQLKTEFFSNISHDLRTPLNILFSVLQLQEFYNRSGETLTYELQAKHWRLMRQNCYRLLRLINNLIDITKYEAGYIEVSNTNRNIVELVEVITTSVADYIKHQGIALVFDTDTEEKMVACDSEKMERILLNLLSNAAKFTPKGGRILVQVEDQQDKVKISVRDTGIGIPPEKLDHVFERFAQVNRSFTREHMGSGIGLSLVKTLVEMHGGIVSAESAPGAGSVFTVLLPVEVLEDTSPKPNPHTTTILDDNRIERIHVEFSDIYTV